MRQKGVRRLKVLFIGNSFTARNDLPRLVERLAEAAGQRLEHRLMSIGGASLRTHWNKGEAAKAIDAGDFHAVVLQEQSTLPIKNAKRMQENVRLFDERIRTANARTVLYMTWARRHSAETQEAIANAYTAIAAETGAAVIPAGVAWRKYISEHALPVLHDRDGSHPTLAGSYLAACTAYGTLFRSSPAALADDVEGLTREEKAMLQAAAAAAVLEQQA
ncbi:MAG TPA: hypothetical protein VER17_10135 [Tepidisphaeraceae bacterium]|nr:hypothetical protein [Tepidisphaeraceae bacterium]